jgi:hypothetical protein
MRSQCYNEFVKKLHEGTAIPDDVFIVDAKLSFPGLFPEAFKSLYSFAVLPFYGGLALGLWLLKARLWGDL